MPGRGRPRPRRGDKVRDGWPDTGDLGSVVGDGYVRLAGRPMDLIIRGGHNLDPAVIEDALLAHPTVSAAAAVGRPEGHAGEVPVASAGLALVREALPPLRVRLGARVAPSLALSSSTLARARRRRRDPASSAGSSPAEDGRSVRPTITQSR